MGFFKDFKEDLTQVAKELMPGDGEITNVDDLQVNTLEQDIDVQSELAKLDGLLEEVPEIIQEQPKTPKEEPMAEVPQMKAAKPKQPAVQEIEESEPAAMQKIEESVSAREPKEKRPEPEVTAEPVKKPDLQKAEKMQEKKEEDIMVNTMEGMERQNAEEIKEEVPVTETVIPEEKEVSDEEAIITKGMKVTGNIETAGSIEIQGNIVGNVACNGKIVVTGCIKGNSEAAEFFADTAKVEGEIKTSGTVKIGLGSVIIGNIEASSAVIAGAIKGDIDVKGPVVVDTSAVVMGNIKSRSVQINNGAVIEGFCSQCYADVDVDSLFGNNGVE